MEILCLSSALTFTSFPALSLLSFQKRCSTLVPAVGTRRRKVSEECVRYFYLLVGLLVVGLGNLAASGIVACDLNGVNITGSCYSSNTFFSNTVPLVTVDWGTAFGSALFSPGSN